MFYNTAYPQQARQLQNTNGTHDVAKLFQWRASLMLIGCQHCMSTVPECGSTYKRVHTHTRTIHTRTIHTSTIHTTHTSTIHTIHNTHTNNTHIIHTHTIHIVTYVGYSIEYYDARNNKYQVHNTLLCRAVLINVLINMLINVLINMLLGCYYSLTVHTYCFFSVLVSFC
jgi:hypothetical protein